MITPLYLVEIIDPRLRLENGNRIFTTLEGENAGGSIKDHMVRAELEFLIKEKKIIKGDSISEVSSGSTAISLAYYCSLLSLRAVLFLPDNAPWKLLFKLQKLGAEVYTKAPEDIYSKYESFSANHPQVYQFNQLFDKSKERHYINFGESILNVMGAMDVVIGGVGTGHSLLGTAKGMGSKEIISAEPEPAFKVSGIRNTEFERYGEKDPCLLSEFTQRVIISKSELIDEDVIYSSEGPIELSTAFKVVLTAAKKYLQDKKGEQIFALGASLKRASDKAA